MLGSSLASHFSFRRVACASPEAMLSLYQSSARYIESERSLLGWGYAGLEASQQSRVSHFVDTIPSKNPDVDDAMATMSELGKETEHFTADQRKLMGDAISAHMRNEHTAGATSGSTKLQKCHDINNMWTDKMWNLFFDKSVSWNHKLETAARFMISVMGIRRPNDNTVKNVVAIIELCHGREMDPNESYKEVHSLRTKISSLRELLPGNIVSMDYPKVGDLVKLHPNMYPMDEPPIPCRVDETEILQRTRKDMMPTISTNKRLKSKVSALVASPSSGSASDINLQLLDYVLNKSPRGPASSPPSEPKASAHRPDPLPIEDKVTTDVCDTTQDGKTTTVAQILDEGKAVLQKEKALKSSTKKKPAAAEKKKKKDEDTSEDDEEEDDDEESETIPKAAIAKGKPKPLAIAEAVSKKGAQKKPASKAIEPLYKQAKYAWILKDKKRKHLFDAGPNCTCSTKGSFTKRAYTKFGPEKDVQRVAYQAASAAWNEVHR
jgi:hypothetical protein